MLDSGRIASRNPFDLKDYIAFCKDHRALIDDIVGFDVVGPTRPWAQKYTPGEMEIGAQTSYANQQTMKAEGLKPIPVYHQGERIHWLEQMLRDGETYIGIAYARTSTSRRRWLDMVFNILCDKDGRPYVKTHGFRITSFRDMTSYPWRSVDNAEPPCSCYNVGHKRSARVTGPDHFDIDEPSSLNPWTMIQYSAEEGTHNRLLSFWRLRDRRFLERLQKGVKT